MPPRAVPDSASPDAALDAAPDAVRDPSAAAQPGSAPSPGGRSTGRGRLVLLAAAAATVSSAAVLTAAAAAASGEALPGTRLAGVDVSGLGAADLRAVVDGPVRDALVAPLPLRAAGTTFPVVPGQVGLALDREAAVAAALEAGREGPLGPVRSGLAALGVLGGTRSVDVVASVDPGLVRSRVQQVREQVDRGTAPGGFTVSPDLQVEVVAPREGRALREGPTVEAVRAALVSGERAPLDATVATTPPPVELADAERVAGQARQALAAPVVLRGPGELALEVAPDLLGPVLGSRVADGTLTLTVDREALTAAVRPQVAALEQQPRDARPRTPRPDVVLTAKGDAAFSARPAEVGVEPGAPGRDLDLEGVAGRVVDAVLAGERSAELPVRTTAPRVPTEALQRVDQLIGSFTTSFPCCQNRVTNIQRIAAIVDGTVVMPGEVLDLNEEAGRRTRARGFLADGAILDGELVDAVGGGVSQFATTLYNAAWFAGLDVVEHKPHSRYISRYPAGREATLDFASIDLIIRNTTDAPVVLRTATTGTSVTAALYGSVGDRTVRSTTGPRQPRDGGGFRVVVSREVLQGGRVVEQDRTSWTYQPPLEP